MLESLEVITKRKLPENKKENTYFLTEIGIDLAPLILEIVLWSDKYVRDYKTKMNSYDDHNIQKAKVIASVQKEYRQLVYQIID